MPTLRRGDIVIMDNLDSHRGKAVREATGRIEIVLSGGIRVIVDKDVDAGALAQIVGVSERR